MNKRKSRSLILLLLSLSIFLILFVQLPGQSAAATESYPALYDRITCFNDSYPELELNLQLEKNMVYRFGYESYTPLVPFYADIWLTSPRSMQYHLWDTFDNVSYTYPIQSTDFAPAESGIYKVEFMMVPFNNVNIRVFVQQINPILNYYESMEVKPSQYVDKNANLKFGEVVMFNSGETEKFFSIPIEADREYWFDCFRTNNLTQSDIETYHYEMPIISIELNITSTIFKLVLSAQTNNDSFETAKQFHVRWGAHKSGFAILRACINPSIFNVNFAIICYSMNIAGETDTMGATNSSKNSSTNSSSAFNQPNSSVFEDWLATVKAYVNFNYDSILLFGSLLIVGLIILNKYVKVRQGKIVTASDIREEMEP